LFHKQVFANSRDQTNKSKKLKALRAFFISSLLHEAIVTLVDRQMTFEQFAFFMVQGIAVYIQVNLIPRSLKDKTPKPVSISLTLVFMAFTSKLYFAPYIRYEKYAVVFSKHSPI
jgi:hypothetical protein